VLVTVELINVEWILLCSRFLHDPRPSFVSLPCCDILHFACHEILHDLDVPCDIQQRTFSLDFVPWDHLIQPLVRAASPPSASRPLCLIHQALRVPDLFPLRDFSIS
jgi:hypothetical protein